VANERLDNDIGAAQFGLGGGFGGRQDRGHGGIPAGRKEVEETNASDVTGRAKPLRPNTHLKQAG
jgi:hypothetical protein